MSTGPFHHLVSCEVSVEGLGSSAAEIAENEVRNLFELLRRYETALRAPVEVSVQLTTDVADTVDRFNTEHGIPAPPYDRSRPQGTSCGITLTVPEDLEVSKHVVVMDAALWSEQSPEQVVYRTQGLAYLLGHINNKHDVARVKPTPPEFKGKYTESLWHSAWALCSVWDDIITAVDICNSCLSDQDGNPVLLVDYFGDQNLLATSELLDQLCVFATFDVGFYRVFTIGLEDLYPTGANLASGLLRTGIEMIALFGIRDRLDDLYNLLSRMNGFSEFLEPIWPSIITGCISEEYPSKIQGFIDAFTTLFDRLGIRMEDLEDGRFYVHVHEPVTCSWKEGAESPT